MDKSRYKISNEDLWMIVENLHDEIMVYDDNYNLVFVNEASLRHYGIPPEELIGKKFANLDGTYWGNSTLPEVYRTKKMTARRQVTNLGQDIITISVPVFDENGNIKFVVQNVNDIYMYDKIGKAEEQFFTLSEDYSRADDFEFIFSSNAMRELMETVQLISQSRSPCLLLGETGTGKSLLAKKMHNFSNRKDGPFVVVNCACMNPNLIESELFGYRKGAFSGASKEGKKGIVEMADGGTLFLDEISEIPLELQGKLLQFIQDQQFTPLGDSKTHKVDVKIIAATNRDVTKMVAAQTFREDLYYRLNTFEIVIPPLRNRKEDIKTLVEYYLEKIDRAQNKKHEISEEAMESLCNYRWPGNVRELSNVVEKVVVLTENTKIELSNLPSYIFEFDRQDSIGDTSKGLDNALEELERELVIKSYERYRTSTGVARDLGISQPKAYRLIQKHILNNKRE